MSKTVRQKKKRSNVPNALTFTTWEIARKMQEKKSKGYRGMMESWENFEGSDNHFV